jgi:hypothetical protein
LQAFFDTEQIQWYSVPLTLASIGIIRDDGRELYLVAEHGIPRGRVGPWFKKNVWPQLENEPKVAISEIATQVRTFLGPVGELITRGGDNDWKLLDGLIGSAWFYKTDIDHIWNVRRQPRLPERQHKAHHALIDARWYRTLYQHLNPSSMRRAA